MSSAEIEPGAVGSLATPRVRLRPLQRDDAPFIRELVNERAWLEYIGDKGVRTLEDARAYIERGPLEMYRKFGVGLLLVETLSPAVPIGVCGLIRRDGLADIDLGFALLERHHGQGLAYEAAQAVLHDAEHRLRLRRVIALTALQNPRSIRLLERLGFRFERVLPATETLKESKVFVRTMMPPLAGAGSGGGSA